MALHLLGVRHHSPACARLVEQTIRAQRPRFVLIEGPSDMNERIAELQAAHVLPVAVFSFAQDAQGHTRGSWSPFCAYSPEWVALQTAREVGATALFMDLPAWHAAFATVENRYADRHARHSHRTHELCARLGFDNVDALWDHLFEADAAPNDLRARLDRYFLALRADEPPEPGDDAREALMAAFLAWALREAAERDVVAVCGGYHQPELLRLVPAQSGARPAVPPAPDGTRTGSYLVPFSFKRLDAFAGYASGMPSPEFYEAVWQHGAHAAGEHMLRAALSHLRHKAQRVSAADAIAAHTLAEGLRTLRGHKSLLRCDLLDGLAGALVKDALDAPLPWTRRGPLGRGTDPLLVELVAAFAGDRFGTLAPGTPQPPLVHDVFAELAALGLSPARQARRVSVSLTTPRGLQQSAALHRLRVLAIPGFALQRGPSLRRGNTDLSEDWQVQHALEAEPALIEAAALGATLPSAATHQLARNLARDHSIAALAEVLVDAAHCRLAAFTRDTERQLVQAAAEEASFAALGQAMHRLLALARGDLVLGARLPRDGAPSDAPFDVSPALRACGERGLWLFEGIVGNAAADLAQIAAVRALRDLLRTGALPSEHREALQPRTLALAQRRAQDTAAPVALRGAALGLLWSLRDESSDALPLALDPVALLRAVALPSTCGDFLVGLFALAREQVLHSETLLAALDTTLSGFSRDDFMVALPALRQAFAFFPPRERQRLAQGVLARGSAPHAAHAQTLAALNRAQIPTALIQHAAATERAAAARAAQFGLLDRHDGATP